MPDLAKFYQFCSRYLSSLGAPKSFIGSVHSLKYMPGINTLAYFGAESVTKKKGIITLTTDWNHRSDHRSGRNPEAPAPGTARTCSSGK